MQVRTLLVVAGLALVGLAGCEEKKGELGGALDKMKEGANKAAEGAKDAANKAASEAKDAAAKTGEAVKDGANKAAETAKDAAAQAGDKAKEMAVDAQSKFGEMTKGLTDQLGGAKGQIDELAKKVEGAPAAVKPEYTKIVDGLKAKYAECEGMVTKFKAAAPADMMKLGEEAKTKAGELMAAIKDAVAKIKL